MKKIYSHTIKEHYEKYWEKTEIPNDYVYKSSIVKRIIPIKKNLKILDYGCGKGTFIEDMLRVNPSLKISGIDISEVAISFAKKKIPGQKFYILTEGIKLPFKDDTFDFIFNLDVLLYVYNTEFVFKELTRVLKPHGTLLITLPYYGFFKNIAISVFGFEIVYNPRNAAIRFYTPKSLTKEVKAAGLTPIKLGYFGRIYPFSHGMYSISKKR